MRKILKSIKNFNSPDNSGGVINLLEKQNILSGKILAEQNRQKSTQLIRNVQLAEFSIFSQWGDDGIIQFLSDYLDIENKTFIEFGVEDYTESNTRFLLQNNNWKGLVMDGSAENVNAIKESSFFWKHDLTAAHHFITVENINQLLKENNFSGDTGLLHIDVDGNDYWIWKAINVVTPVVVIIEYNSVFGTENPWSIPYTADFNRTAAHSSNLYWGTSLLSLCDLSGEKGYSFIGSNSAGNNAYFVRKDKLKDLKIFSCGEGYVESKYRESRNVSGGLTFLSGTERLKEISGMDIINTRTNKTEKIS